MPEFYSNRQGERSGQRFISFVAHAVVLSIWHDVQGFGILYLSVMAGAINENVCARTKTPGISASILGMWQLTQFAFDTLQARADGLPPA